MQRFAVPRALRRGDGAAAWWQGWRGAGGIHVRRHCIRRRRQPLLLAGRLLQQAFRGDAAVAVAGGWCVGRRLAGGLFAARSCGAGRTHGDRRLRPASAQFRLAPQCRRRALPGRHALSRADRDDARRRCLGTHQCRGGSAHLDRPAGALDARRRRAVARASGLSARKGGVRAGAIRASAARWASARSSSPRGRCAPRPNCSPPCWPAPPCRR